MINDFKYFIRLEIFMHYLPIQAYLEYQIDTFYYKV